jgi:hypothetical protein
MKSECNVSIKSINLTCERIVEVILTGGGLLRIDFDIFPNCSPDSMTYKELTEYILAFVDDNKLLIESEDPAP